ncbi:hypothetical protein F0Z19_3022 [Vibrio cyclitrophicus]|nr:hypothetical protein F0Z19_3022 [Vibrio cyclitrophicus]
MNIGHTLYEHPFNRVYVINTSGVGYTKVLLIILYTNAMALKNFLQ